MFDILLILYLGHMLHISNSKSIHCAITNEKNPKVKVVTCEPRVEHCLIFLHRESEDVEYVQQAFGCMPWDELVVRCPSTIGVCNILHGDYEHHTCCCRGSMCNNKTLQLVTVDDINTLTGAPSGMLANFGVIQRDANEAIRSSMDNYAANQNVFIYSVSIGAVFLLVLIFLCFALTIKYGACESQGYGMYSVYCFKRKTDHTTATTSVSNRNEGQSHSVTTKTRRRSLIYRMLLPSPTSTTTPLLMSDEAVGMSNSRISSMHCDVIQYQLANSSSFGDVTKLHSAEKLAMQHIVEGCQKVRLLGHGRFAEVWLASLSDSVVRQSAAHFQSVFKTATGPKTGSAMPTGQNEQAADATNPSPGSTADGTGEYHELVLHPSPAPTANTGHSLSDHALRTCRTESARDNNTTAHATPDHSCEIAIKVFPANDYKSWSAELSIFRALQEPLGHRLLSASDTESLSLSDLIFRSTGGAPPAATGAHPSNCHATTSTPTDSCSIAFSSTIPDSDLSERHVSTQSRHVNLIQLIAAGVVNEEIGDAAPGRLLREHRLVLEYAAGGSLRSLLSSPDWLSTARMLQITRDIARGLSFLHSDVSHERSATRGSLAKLPIAHRDLKPENILLRANGTACLSDFGQATLIADATPECRPGVHNSSSCPLAGREAAKTSSSSYWSDVFSQNQSSTALHYGQCSLDCMPQAGTLRYMAPELLDGAINFTGTSLLRTDIYSLGLVLWEVMTAVYVPDHQHLVPRPDSSGDRQAPTGGQARHLLGADGKQAPALALTEVEEDEGAVTRGYVAGWEVFGQGFRLLTSGWQGDTTSSSMSSTLQHQHYPPPPPSVGVLREPHRLPYELELDTANNTARYYRQQQSLEEHAGPSTSLLLRQLVVVDKYRPMENYRWSYYTVLSQLHRTATECWDPEPDARLTADCVLERINTLLDLLKRCSSQSDDHS